jgi:hypothetical protein
MPSKTQETNQFSEVTENIQNYSWDKATDTVRSFQNEPLFIESLDQFGANPSDNTTMEYAFLSDIGPSDTLRRLVSKTDEDPKPITVKLDVVRQLRIVVKTSARDELIVRCRDTDDRTTVVLHLPYAPGAAGRATVITRGEY